MSETIEIANDGDIGLVPGPTERLLRRERGGSRRDADEVERDAGPAVSIEAGSQISPEEALAEAKRKLTDKDGQLAAATRRAQQAEMSAKEARDQAARANQARVGDRLGAVASAVEAAAASKDQAKAAMKLALESGDHETFLEAQEAFNNASFRLMNGESELAQIKAAGGAVDPTSGAQTQPPDKQPPDNRLIGPDGNRYTPQAMEFLNNHPRFWTDQEYKDMAIGAHTAAIQSGIVEGSQAYFNHIKNTLARAYGDTQGSRNGGADNMDRPGNFSGAPPSRGGGGTTAGGHLQTLFGPVQVTRNNGKITRVQVPPDQMPEWTEWARIANMPRDEYIRSQVEISEERRRNGGTADLQQGEGQVWR